MIDHLTLTVSDLPRSLAFYDRVLQPIGYSVQMKFENYVGYGRSGKPVFWLKTGPMPQTPMHIAFVAIGRPEVDAFHAAALAAGGRDDGAPGLRPHYHANYYAAFVLDPDGHPIEAVCHLAPGAKVAAPKAKAKAKAKTKAKAKAKMPVAKKAPKRGGRHKR